MKVLLISNYQKGIGGIDAQVKLLHTFLNKEKGISADIFSTKGNPLIRILKWINLLCIVPQYDVLHIHACSYWGMIPVVMGVIAGNFWHKHIVITYHGGEAADFFANHINFVKRWLSRADKVVVLSGFLKDIFNQYDIPCEIVPNIVVLQIRPKREDVIAPKFISIRHLEPLYDIPCVLKAYKQVLEYHPDATLDVLGQGSMREQLEQYVIDNHLTGVRFLGQVSNSQIYESLNNADILLSAAKADNMPVSLLEAMNAEVLVIASRVGGVPYMINEGKNGLLFESSNSQDLAAKMLWALAHPKEIEEIRISAQVEAKKYTWDNVKEKILKLYE